MTEIAEYTENDIDYEKRFRQLEKIDNPDVTDAISHATCMTAIDINAGGNCYGNQIRQDCPHDFKISSEMCNYRLYPIGKELLSDESFLGRNTTYDTGRDGYRSIV